MNPVRIISESVLSLDRLAAGCEKGDSGRLAATASGKVAAPAVLAESGTDFLLPPQPDHQMSG